jgi:stress response protein SCP2
MLIFTGNATTSNVNLSITGDGQSVTLVVELEKSPLNLDIKSNLPVALSGVSFGNIGSGSAVLNTDKRSVTVTYDTALTAGQGAAVSFNLEYAGRQ